MTTHPHENCDTNIQKKQKTKKKQKKQVGKKMRNKNNDNFIGFSYKISNLISSLPLILTQGYTIVIA